MKGGTVGCLMSPIIGAFVRVCRMHTEEYSPRIRKRALHAAFSYEVLILHGARV